MRILNFPMKVCLTSKEVRMCALSGVDRVAESLIENDRGETYGSARNASVWSRHIEGACGEYVVAKCTGRFWPGAGEVFDPNIPWDIGVRTTEWPTGSLILHPDSPDHHTFWLVTGSLGDYTVEGWLYGADGKKDEFWTEKNNNGRPAFFIKRPYLNHDFMVYEANEVPALLARKRKILAGWQDYARSLEAQFNNMVARK